MTKEFILTEPRNLPSNKGGEQINQSGSYFLKLSNAQEIVYFLSYKKYGTAVVVPGIVVSEIYKTEYGKEAVKVEQIKKGSSLEKEIKGKLRHKGNLNFW